MIDKRKLNAIQNLVIELEVDYQRMSRSGREIYDELSKELGLDPVELNVAPYCHIGE